MSENKPFCWILVLNYNGWPDTIELLESIFRLQYDRYRVIVIDNHSADGSVDHILAWAEGHLDVHLNLVNPLRSFTWPPVSKPIPHTRVPRSALDQGGFFDPPDFPLTILENDTNTFYAGGNNVGLRWFLNSCSAEYVWILNNDTVVDPQSLSRLVAAMEENPRAGLCGSTLLYYHQPEIIQALGGWYNKWLGLSRHLGTLHPWPGNVRASSILKRINYICGASVLVSRPFLKIVGDLDESYTIFFEDLDWAFRARGYFEISYAPGSIVYHKEGATAGSTLSVNGKSVIADYHALKNRIRFTRKYNPWAIPLVYSIFIVSLINRIRRGQLERVKMVWLILADDIFGTKTGDVYIRNLETHHDARCYF